VLDINMPKMGGGEAFSRMKQINPQVRAVLSSGFGLDGEAQKLLNRGGAAFIQKPYEYRELIRVIVETIGRSEGNHG
jgi:CheY-like chemotaxis protein